MRAITWALIFGVSAACGGRSGLGPGSLKRDGSPGSSAGTGGLGPVPSGAGGAGPASVGGVGSGGAPSMGSGAVAGVAGAAGEGGSAGEAGSGGESEPGDVLWAVSFRGEGFQGGSDIAVRDDGVSWVTGSAENTTDFGLGPVQATSSEQAFLARLDAQGHADEARLFEGTGRGQGISVALADSGDVAVAGRFDGVIDFGAHTIAALPAQGRDAFVVHFDAAGSDVLALASGASGNQSANGVVFSGDGRSVASLSFERGPGAIAWGVESAGTIGWSATASTPEHPPDDLGASDVVLASNGDAIVAGHFYPKIELCGQELTSGVWRDVFLARFAPTGECLSSRRIDSGLEDIVSRLAHDDGDVERIAITGYHYIVSDVWDPEKGGVEAFVRVLDAQGEPIFERTIGGPGDEHAYAAAFDDDGNLLVTGSYRTDAGYTQHGVLPASFPGANNLFVVKYDPLGNLVWARGIGAEGSQWGTGIGADAAGSIYVTGAFSGELPYRESSLSSSIGDYDAFVLKLEP